MAVSVVSGSDPLAVYSIGLKLRTLRTAKHLTLARLSAQSGFSTALLSKLETDRMVPTLHTLETICRVFGINLGHFFCEPQHHSVAITRGTYKPERREHHLAHLTPLHILTADTQQVSQIIELPPGVSSTIGECGMRTEVTAYVIAGALHISVAGSNEALEQGDSIVVTTDQVMVWTADQKSSCRIFSVSVRHSPGHAPNKQP